MIDRIEESAPFIKTEMSSSQNYSKLEEHDCEDEQCQPPSRPQSPRWGWQLLALGSSFLLGIMAVGIFLAACKSISFTKAAPNRNIPPFIEGNDERTGLPLSWYNGDCGSTTEEAIALDCRFSIVLHAWLPENCLTDADVEDEELMYEGRDWPYELDNGTSLTKDELRSGDFHHFTTTFDWHVTHCMYVWKRVHRVMLDADQMLDSYTANFHHTNHCVKMIGGDPGGMKDSGTKIFVKYPICA